MKTILCYGDSNTWGSISTFEPPKGPSSRFDEKTRWGSVLRADLGEDFRVIEEGLCGRTSIYGTGEELYKNGEPYLLPCLLSHRPLDLVILMLGSNDLKLSFGVTRETLGDGVTRLIHIIKGCAMCGTGNVPPRILIISPTLITRPEGRKDFYIGRGEERAEALTAAFAQALEGVAAREGCAFMDAARYAAPSPLDGLHMDAASHRRLGHAVAEQVKMIFA